MTDPATARKLLSKYRRADRWITRCLLVATVAMVAWSIADGDAFLATVMAFLVGLAAREALTPTRRSPVVERVSAYTGTRT